MSVMFENRSFDNLLGHLYEPGEVEIGRLTDDVCGADAEHLDQSGVVRGMVGGVSVRVGSGPSPKPGPTMQITRKQLLAVCQGTNQLLNTPAWTSSTAHARRRSSYRRRPPSASSANAAVRC